MGISAKPFGTKSIALINGRRMTYIDRGTGDAIVFQHGNPTSSYLWRNIMPYCEGLGRLVACDLIGMGNSDKLDPSGPDRYSFAEQRDYLFRLWDELALGDNITFVLHDWGSVLGFDWARQNASRVRALVYMEAIVRPLTWADWPEMHAASSKVCAATPARTWCCRETYSLSAFCRAPSCASSLMRKWQFTARHSQLPAKPGAQP